MELHDVESVKALDGFRLTVRFTDGVSGEVAMSRFGPMTGVFAALKDKALFAQVCVHPELRCVCWPNGADIDNETLYNAITHPAPGKQRSRKA